MAHNNKQLLCKLAYLEFVHDQLATELQYVDTLLRSLGFPMGLESAKLVAQELLEESDEYLGPLYDDTLSQDESPPEDNRFAS